MFPRSAYGLRVPAGFFGSKYMLYFFKLLRVTTMKSRKLNKALQSGFTLIELIIVIVILGILAAVAIPKLTSTSAAAYEGVQDATVGALKSAWSVAYAKKKSAPNLYEIAFEMSDPLCPITTTATVITCTGVKQNTGTGSAEFSATLVSGVVESPSTITVSKR
jgi:prepilin-type N-terminal cleavage/methylation domain-containing protein